MSGKPRTARSKKLIIAVQEMGRSNPKRSARQMDKTWMWVWPQSEESSKIKKDKKEIIPHTCQKNKKELMEQRFFSEFCKLARKSEKLFLFYEKLFTIEAYVNNQIERLYANYSAVINKSVRTVYRWQKPFSLIVWTAVSKSWNSPLVFVEKGIKINIDLKINNILVLAFEEMIKKIQKSPFHLPTRWSTVPQLNKNSRLVQTSFSKTLE